MWHAGFHDVVGEAQLDDEQEVEQRGEVAVQVRRNADA